MTSPLDKLLDWYANLTPETVKRASEHYARNARFRDPFNDVRGIPAIEAIFRHMFEHTENPRFIIKDRMQQGGQGFATWVFEFKLRGKAYQVEGSSHILFGDDGLVAVHRDYWDAAEELFQKLPLVGAPIRWLRRRFKVNVPGPGCPRNCAL